MLKNIVTTARTEFKLLIRMKTVRIVWFLFGLITLFFVVVSHTSGFFQPFIPAGLALKAYFFFTLVRMITASFIAPVFVREDRLHDAFQALSPRPFTNTAYVAGKLLAYTALMLVMDYVFMAVFFISAIINPAVPVSVWPYVLYPLFITLPLSVFLFGLNVLAARIFYPLVYLVPLLSLTVFLPLEDLEITAWRDLGAISLPLAYSAMTGFHHVGQIIFQRSIFFMAGFIFISLGLMFFEITRFSGLKRGFTTIVIALLVAWGLLAWKIPNDVGSERNFHKWPRIDETKYAPVGIESYDITVIHSNAGLAIRSQIALTNTTDSTITRINLKENYYFRVNNVMSGNTPLRFSHRSHKVSIELDKPLESHDSMTIEIEAFASRLGIDNYYYISDAAHGRIHREGLTTLGKQTGYIEPDYVLLPAEMIWYPASFSSHETDNPGFFQRDPVHFTLEVTTHDDLTVISQGKMIKTGDNTWRFEPETPLTQMSLAIGPYRKASAEVDGIEYSYYWMTGDPFKDSGISRNMLEAAIRTTKKDIETRLGIEYPFNRYQIVETPINFFGYNSAFDLSSPYVQPEIRFIPESSLNLRHLAKQLSPPEVLNTAITSRYRTSTRSRAIKNKLYFSSSLFSKGGILKFATDPHEDYSSIVSQYTAFTRGPVSGDDYLNLLAFTRLRSKLGISDQSDFNLLRMLYSPSDTAERQFLSGKCLRDILGDERYACEAMDILKMASSSFLRLLAAKSGVDEYEIDNAITRAWSDSTADLAASLCELCGTDVLALFDDFSRQTQKAHYELTGLTITKHLIDHRTVYNLRFNIANPTPSQGLLNFDAFGQDQARETVYLEPFTRKEVGLVLEDIPRYLFYYWLPFGTYDSEDLVLDLPVREGTESEFFEGVRCTADGTLPVAIVMDNLDDACRVISSAPKKPLQRFFGSRDKSSDFIHYATFKGLEKAPDRWTLSKSYGDGGTNDFYGYYSSCYYTKAGDGESVVEYPITIPAPGEYDVYLSVPKGQGLQMFLTPLFQSGELGETTVRVMTANGPQEATVDISREKDDWAYVGTYPFTGTTAEIQITDKSRAKLVIADAVKVSRAE